MDVCDVNVYVYAHRRESERHEEYAALVDSLRTGPHLTGVSELVLSAFVRVVTHAKPGSTVELSVIMLMV